MKQLVEIHTYEGPSRILPYRSVVAQFSYQRLFGEPPQPIEASRLEILKPYLDDDLRARLWSHCPFPHGAALAAVLAVAIQEIRCSLGLRTASLVARNGTATVASEYHSSPAARQALKLAIELAQEVLKASDSSSSAQLAVLARQVLQQQQALQPRPVTALQIKAARSLDIPYYPLFDRAKYVIFGQGEKARIFQGAASDRDSAFGTALQQNKMETCQLLSLAGFPVPRQQLVKDRERAQAAARAIGFPVVVKPLDAGQGRGITANIVNNSELSHGFALARPYSQLGVIVESHILGLDHRITICDGKLLNVLCREPAQVVGDGRRTIRELIDRENADRDPELKRQGFLKSICVDENLTKTLESSALTLDAIPEVGRKVALRTNANVSTGGTFRDVTNNTHPDNVQMALDITRLLRVDTLGVDFITRDIGRSWRDEGTIIEINTSPGLLEGMVRLALKSQFPGNNPGRIPTTLVVTAQPPDSPRPPGQGLVTLEQVWLGDQPRRLPGRSLYQRCLALLIDPACRELVVAAPWQYLWQHGLPLDRVDRCELHHPPSGSEATDFATLINTHCRAVDHSGAA
ncbi:MAG: ATP-grasp domain-containing protein [Porticoccaceae bacterium]|nr:ATP-grasp domain-containing protein [Porticoccaceae bacterium]